MISRKYRILLIISLVFNLAFVTAFIFRGVQIAKHQGRPFPHPFERPPHMGGLKHKGPDGHRGPRGPEHEMLSGMKDKFMSESLRNNMDRMDELKSAFFKELMKDEPSYTKLDSIKLVMNKNSEDLSNCISEKLIEVRKNSSPEEIKKRREMFKRHLKNRYPRKNRGRKDEQEHRRIK